MIDALVAPRNLEKCDRIARTQAQVKITKIVEAVDLEEDLGCVPEDVNWAQSSDCEHQPASSKHGHYRLYHNIGSQAQPAPNKIGTKQDTVVTQWPLYAIRRVWGWHIAEKQARTGFITMPQLLYSKASSPPSHASTRSSSNGNANLQTPSSPPAFEAWCPN